LVQAELVEKVLMVLMEVVEYKVIHLHLDQQHQQQVVDMVELILQMLVVLVDLAVGEVDLVVVQDLQLLDKEMLVELVLLVIGLALLVVAAPVVLVEMVHHHLLIVFLLMILADTAVLVFNSLQYSEIPYQE